MITLQDLKGKTENEILEHLAVEYSGEVSGHDYGEITDLDIEKAKERLKDMAVLIAYESVGDYGCDSSSYFLLKNKETGNLFEVHGSHCSCYGFEGQLDMEETTVEALKYRATNGGSLLSCGGYDDDCDANQASVKEFILSM